MIAIFRRAAEDRLHGAGEIELAFLTELLAVRDRWTADGIAAGAEALLRGQPAMASLSAFAAKAASTSPQDLERDVRRRLEALQKSADILAERAWRWIEESERVVTISRSSAVAGVLRSAWRRGWQGEAVVLEGTSAGRGSEQARDLAADGPARSCPDAAAASLLDGLVVVAVGADTVGPDRFVNCAGTRALLVEAAARDVPRLLVADRGKDADAAAVAAVAEAPPMHRGEDGGEWPLFEGVPLALITERISD